MATREIARISRFKKVSEIARHALEFSEKERQRLNHSHIGTEHILLGLINETEGVAARVLFSMEVDLRKVRSAVEFITRQGEKPAQGEIGLTPRAKKVVELAAEETNRMNHPYIGTQHLLIGLLREGEGVAPGILEILGVTLDKVRERTHSILSQTPGSEQDEEAIMVQPNLVSLAQQLVGLQEEFRTIEARIEEIQEMQQRIPALEDEREMKDDEIRKVKAKLCTLLAEREPQ